MVEHDNPVLVAAVGRDRVAHELCLLGQARVVLAVGVQRDEQGVVLLEEVVRGLPKLVRQVPVLLEVPGASTARVRLVVALNRREAVVAQLRGREELVVLAVAADQVAPALDLVAQADKQRCIGVCLLYTSDAADE